MWDYIIYPCPKLNGIAIAVLELISNLIPYFTGQAIQIEIVGLWVTCPRCDEANQGSRLWWEFLQSSVWDRLFVDEV